MLLLILFAFIAGIVTILSPCILPILPIVLSGSLGGGKRRPFGVIAGFILSFTFFTLFLASIVNVTGVSADAVRSISVVIVLLFGLSLLVPQFQVLTERLFSKLSGLIPMGKEGKSGFLGGMLIGVSLGLVWTPCVGPILASVISLALTGSVTGSAFLITLAYATGTAIPLLAITYSGRRLFQRVPWLLNKSGLIQKIFGVIMILTALSIYFNIDRKFQTYILETFPEYGVGLTQIENNYNVQRQLEEFNQKPADDMLGKTTRDMIDQSMLAPELIPGGTWFNPPSPEAMEGQVLQSLRGKVVLVDFWTYTCINCIRTLPYLRDWHAKYAEKGLVIIGVHTPEFEFEKNPENVRKAIQDFGLKYPIMQDNEYATWQAYDNHYWPAKYFIDKNGRIRSKHFGEGDYDESEKLIQDLLAETGVQANMPINNAVYSIETRTPELYLGYDRLRYFASPEQPELDREKTYTAGDIPANSLGYMGVWTLGKEYAMPKKGSKLILNFSAKQVFLVMRPKEKGLVGKLRLNYDQDNPSALKVGGEDVIDGEVIVAEDRLYELIKLPNAGEHMLQLEFLDDNLELYAFTFG